MTDLADWTVHEVGLSSVSVSGDVPDWTEVDDQTGTGTGGGGGGGGSMATGYTALWDATEITGHVDGSALNSWPDQSVNHYDLGQANGVNQPIYYSSTAAYLIGGKPTVNFQAAIHYLTTSGSFAWAGPVLIQAVVCMNAGGSASGYLVAGAPTNSEAVWMAAGIYDCRTPFGSVGGGSVDTNPHTVTWYLASNGTGYIRVDGSQVNTGGFGAGALTAGTLYMGTDSSVATEFYGRVGLVVIYCNSTLTPGQIASNEAALKAAWGTP